MPLLSALAVVGQLGWKLELQEKSQHAEAPRGLPVLTQGLVAAAGTSPSNRISSAPLEESVLCPEALCPHAVLVSHLSSVSC